MEAVTRRLSRLHAEGKPFPDLLLIDGGKGQLRSALQPLAAYANPPMIVAIAKREETIFSPSVKDPVQLPPASPARKLIERIRNEVHRWALSYHRNIRGRQFKRSSLEDSVGIGKKRASELLKRFGSTQRIAGAAAEDIAKIQGISLSSAKKLLEHLKSP
jgi:excinuclease ABC subunit C